MCERECVCVCERERDREREREGERESVCVCEGERERGVRVQGFKCRCPHMRHYHPKDLPKNVFRAAALERVCHEPGIPLNPRFLALEN